MSNNNEQNGRQPPLPHQFKAPPSDPRNKSCRDFAWGICTKGAQCKYQHELDFEFMKATLKFCHDYQNKTGCTRQNCTYLHTSKEEEDLFLATGQMPRILAGRHASMSSVNMAPEGIPQVVYQCMSQPPPPPPPAPQMNSGAAPPPLPASLSPLLALPPPPPPPTATSTPVRATAPLYTAPPPHNASAVPFIIDTSRPPPPMGTTIGNKNDTFKRPAEPCEAGPRKARKAEGSKIVDSLCENCVQREFRIEVYRKEMQKLECEKVCQSYILEQKSDAYDIGKLLLKSVVSPDLFLILDEYIEGSTQELQIHDLLAQLIQAPSFVSSSSTLPRQFLLQFTNCNNYGNLRNLIDIGSSSSVSMEEASLLQSITALARRANPITNHTSDLQTVIEVLRNAASSSERLQSIEPRPSTSNITSIGVNGLNHFLNGQKLDVAGSTKAVSPNRYASPPGAAGRPYPSAGVASAGPAGAAAASAPTPAAHAAYLPYHVAHPPPPARPCYPQSYGPSTPNMANAPTYNSTPIRGGLTPQTAVRHSTSAPPPNPHNYNTYAMGRYPSHYYPPFQ